MEEGTMSRSRFAAVLAAGVVAFTLGACSHGSTGDRTPRDQASMHIEGSTKAYSDVDALGADSDLIVRGRITARAGTAMDDGGLEAGTDPVPMAVYTVDVTTRAANADTPATLTLGNIDLGKVQSNDVAPLTVGQEYVFFLVKRTANTAPGVVQWTPFYVPTGGGFGVFRIGNDGRAQAYQPGLTKIHAADRAGERVNDRLVADPAALLAVKKAK
jgi:hypothetical protein